MIHPTSLISSKAVLGKNVKIGPFCIIDDNVSLNDDCELISNVHITGNTIIGKNNKFFPYSTIGTIPQDLKFKGEDSKLIIGNNNSFREHVTVNPGTFDGGMITKINDNCTFMVGSHIAHDCYIGSNVILVNNAILAGHVIIEDNAIIGGNSAVHQFVKIGKYAMIGGMSGVETNIIPYGLYTGIRDSLRGLNLVGLKRKKVDSSNIITINNTFKKIFDKSYSIDKNISMIDKDLLLIAEIKEIVDFISLNLKRGLCRYKDD